MRPPVLPPAGGVNNTQHLAQHTDHLCCELRVTSRLVPKATPDILLSDARDDGPIVSHTGHTATQCHISISALDDTEQV